MKNLFYLIFIVTFISCSGNSDEENVPNYLGEYALKKYELKRDGVLYTATNFEGTCRGNTTLTFQKEHKVIYKRYGISADNTCDFYILEKMYDDGNQTLIMDGSAEKVKFDGGNLILSKSYTVSDSQSSWNEEAITYYKKQ